MPYKHMLMDSMKTIKTPKLLHSKTNKLYLLIIIILLYSLSSFSGLIPPFLIGFFFLTFLPGYLICSAFFSDRIKRLVFAPALSIAVIILPVVLLNTLPGFLITSLMVNSILLVVLLLSSFVWFRFSKKPTRSSIPRTLLVIIAVAIISSVIPAVMNGMPGDSGITYGGTFDNDPWLQQAYASRLLIEKDIPIHDPFVANVDVPRFYHYGMHVYMLSLHYLTSLRFFQILQILAVFLPVWFVLTAYTFLRKFLKEKTSLIITFLFILGGGFGGPLLLLEINNHLQTQDLYSLPDYMMENKEVFTRPMGVATIDILYSNNLPLAMMFMPQAAGFMMSVFLFPILYLIIKRNRFDKKTRLLAGSLAATSMIFHAIFSLIIIAAFVLYLIFEHIQFRIDRKAFTDLIDILIVFLVLYIPYFVNASFGYVSGIQSAEIITLSNFLYGNLFLPVVVGLGLIFLIGIPFLLYNLKSNRTHLILFLIALLIVSLALLSNFLPMGPQNFRNYATRLVFIPAMIGFGIFLERSHVLKKPIILAIVILIVAVSPVINSMSYYYVTFSGKDSISYGEWEALEWIRNTTSVNSVFLTSEYEIGPFSKIAVFTGRFVFVGGTAVLYFNDTKPLKAEVDLAYNTTNQDDLNTILEKYRIDYIYIGPNERELYTKEGLEKFESFDSVFRNEDVTIFISSAAQ
jgi:hypothetical protein